MRAGACRPAWRARRVASRSAPRRAHDVSKGGRCRLRAQGWTPSPAAPPLTLRLSHLARAPQSTGRPPAQARLHCRPRPAAPRAWPAPAAEREACIGEQRRTSVPPRLRLAGPLVPPAAAPRSAGPGWGCAALMATRVCAAARASASCAGPALVVSRQRGARRMPHCVASCCLILGAGAHQVCPGVSRAGGSRRSRRALRCSKLCSKELARSALHAPHAGRHRATVEHQLVCWHGWLTGGRSGRAAPRTACVRSYFRTALASRGPLQALLRVGCRPPKGPLEASGVRHTRARGCVLRAAFRTDSQLAARASASGAFLSCVMAKRGRRAARSTNRQLFAAEVAAADALTRMVRARAQIQTARCGALRHAGAPLAACAP